MFYALLSTCVCNWLNAERQHSIDFDSNTQHIPAHVMLPALLLLRFACVLCQGAPPREQFGGGMRRGGGNGGGGGRRGGGFGGGRDDYDDGSYRY